MQADPQCQLINRTPFNEHAYPAYTYPRVSQIVRQESTVILSRLIKYDDRIRSSESKPQPSAYHSEESSESSCMGQVEMDVAAGAVSLETLLVTDPAVSIALEDTVAVAEADITELDELALMVASVEEADAKDEVAVTEDSKVE